MLARRSWQLKYAIEWGIAVGLVVGAFPLMALVAIAIKMQDGGAIFYISRRCGRYGREFNMIKFRTMRIGSQEIRQNNKTLVYSNDPRVTRLGHYLRFGIDELPQLFNVIRGEMCIIGPRPTLAWDVATYRENEKLRLAVLPGITGLAQACGGRELENAKNLQLDLEYVTRSNIIVDLAIAHCTVLYMIGATSLARQVLTAFTGTRVFR